MAGIAALELCAQTTVTTSPAGGITSFQAVLNGSVNPDGMATQVWFQYGIYSDMSDSQQSLVLSAGSGTAAAPFQTTVMGLDGNRTYYFQAFASNSAGTVHGAILSLTTPANPLLSASVTHTGNFVQGQTGAAYSITVSNAAAGGATYATVAVTETVPSGLTLTSMTGPNWFCKNNVCQRNDTLGPGASYPPITVLVNVAANAPAQVTNQISVTGLGLYGANASDVTAISPLSGEQQFINTMTAAIGAEASAIAPAAHPLIFGGNLELANGATIGGTRQEVLLDYVDGLKAAGVQRVDLNPGVTSINDPNATALYDAVVQHIRELGLQLAINPEVSVGELGSNPTFEGFQAAALAAYPQLAARYQPDNFVIAHLPTTMAARLGVQTAPSDWDGFIRALAPQIKAASPHTRLGAGGFYNEDAYYQDFLGIADLDFLTMTIFDSSHFAQYVQWAQEAQAAADATHPNGKSVYIDETWAPFYLPAQLPSNWQVDTLSSLALVGPCNSDFAAMDAQWLELMVQFASANGMEAITPFTTEAFFQYGPANADNPDEAAYSAAAQEAILQGQLTTTGRTYLAQSVKWGSRQAASLSSASYATLPTVFNPNCGGADPCNADATVAPDSLVSAFGADLAASSAVTPSASFPTNLAGTTMTLVDSSGASFDVGMYFASPGQVNYLAPSNVKPGPATITINSSDGTRTGGTLLVSPVAPGIYTAAQSGSGPAAGIAICAGICSGWPNPQGNGQFYQNTFAAGCTPGSCAAQTLSLGGAGDQVVVELFGTGIRHISSLAAISAAINGQSVPVIYAGAQGQYPGLDQVNVQIPHSLAGSGAVSLVLTIQDTVNHVTATSNAVTLHIL